jgi:hypothetical protein
LSKVHFVRCSNVAALVFLPLAFGAAGCSLTLASDAELSGGGATSVTSSIYASTVMGDGPVAYWRLDETSGTTAHDVTGHGHDGAYTASCQLGVGGALLNDTDPAAGFDGMTSTISAPPRDLDFAGTSPFSVEGWVSVGRINNAFHHVINHESPAGNREGYAVFVQSTGNLAFERFVAAAGTTLQGPTATHNEWYYVVGTYDGALLTLYVNSTVAARADDTRSRSPLADDFYIGAGESTRFYDGDIDEVAIYDKALTQAQITAHWHAAGR